MQPFEEPRATIDHLFADVVREAFEAEIGRPCELEIEQYLVQLLVRFLHTDAIFALKNADGHRLISISEMIPEGDVRLNASSFERERQVHRHIGDFLLFWNGVYPEFLKQLKLCHGVDLICDYTRQGKESYHVVSTFDMPPHDQEAPTFRKLSEGFEMYAYALRGVRRQLPA